MGEMGWKWFLLRWLRGPANIVQGVCQFVTFGLWDPNISLRVESAFLDEAGKCLMAEEFRRGV